MGINNINSFGEVLLWSFWIFIWIAAIMIWFRCVFDMFSNRTLSGWGKAGWAIVLIFVPWLGAVIYLIVRGRSMSERQMQAMADAQAQQEKYIKAVPATPAHPPEHITHPKGQLHSGTIPQQEFDA